MFKTTMVYVNLIIVVSCLVTSSKGTNFQSNVTKSSFDTTSSPPITRKVSDSVSKNIIKQFVPTTLPHQGRQDDDSVPEDTIKQIVATTRPHQGDFEPDVIKSPSIITNMTSITRQIDDCVDQITKFLNDTEGYSNDL